MGARSSAPRGESAPHLREGRMRMKDVLMSAGLAFVLLQVGFLPAAAQAPAALTGQVTSAEEGAMEGVLVSARKAGSTMAVTVVSDAQGNFSFPASKLEPCECAFRTMAIGRALR